MPRASRFSPSGKPLPCPDGHWGHDFPGLLWYVADGLDAVAVDADLDDGLALLDKVCGATDDQRRAASRAQWRAWRDECWRWAGIRESGYGRGDAVNIGSIGIYGIDAGWPPPPGGLRAVITIADKPGRHTL